jgi:hypothetical protein
MSPIASSRLWYLPTAALMAGAVLLALISGDPLLLLGVFCAVAGLILLARPAPARSAAVLPLPRKRAARRAATGGPAVLQRHGSHIMPYRQRHPAPALPAVRATSGRARLVAAEH